MMQLNRHLIIGLTAAAFAATAVFAGGHDATPAQKAVKARQGHMGLYAFNLGQLGAMAKGEMDFNADMAQGAADNLATLATMNQSAYWPPGTSTLDMEGTAALPDIWDKYPDIADKAKALVDASMAMQAAAGSLDGVRAAIGAVGASCDGCHKVYRQSDS